MFYGIFSGELGLASAAHAVVLHCIIGRMTYFTSVKRRIFVQNERVCAANQYFGWSNWLLDLFTKLTQASDQQITGLALPALADNGGIPAPLIAPKTRAITDSSPAYNAKFGCTVDFDQRGRTRSFSRDAGSYEYGGVATAVKMGRVSAETPPPDTFTISTLYDINRASRPTVAAAPQN